ncbi:prolipoprotein diacylglyceryl transferase, partial [Aggregatibacter actinomycetemcomitans serotype d str. SA3733]
GFMGVFLGGRIGDVFFYNLDHFLQDPLYLFRVWEGGMSFHGGLIGVIIAMILTSKTQKRNFWATADFVAPLIPFGLGMGRLGNFINLELWGRQTDVPWAMIFPTDPLLLSRHPSQLYEAFLEGLVLFLILNWFIRKPRPMGSVAGLFLIGYGCFRFIIEYVREPDVELFLDVITRGQLLCLPMILGGMLIMFWTYNKSAVKK